MFGPITLVWFLAIGASGLMHIFDDPEILLAINPYYIVGFLTNQPDVAFVTIGAIFLAVTGAEALYADLGHFRPPAHRAGVAGHRVPMPVAEFLSGRARSCSRMAARSATPSSR